MQTGQDTSTPRLAQATVQPGGVSNDALQLLTNQAPAPIDPSSLGAANLPAANPTLEELQQALRRAKAEAAAFAEVRQQMNKEAAALLNLRQQLVKQAKDAAAAEQGKTPAGKQGNKVLVNQIVFSQVSAYFPEDFANLAKNYENRRVSFANLEQLVARINLLYANAGITTAEAILPEQNFFDGTVVIELVEAVIASVRVQGLPTTADAFMRSQISLVVGEKPDFTQLANDLRTIELTHDFRPAVVFSPGPQPATTVATITGQEPNSLTLAASLDNFGDPGTGEIRFTGSVTGRSLLGLRDVATLSAQVSDGAFSLSGGYELPVFLPGGEFFAEGSLTASEVVNGVFAQLGLQTRSASGTAGYRQHFAVTANRDLLASIMTSGETSSTELQGVSLTDTSLIEYAGALQITASGPTASLSVKGQAGFGASDSKQAQSSDGPYWIANGELQYVNTIGDLALSQIASAQYVAGQDITSKRYKSVGGAESLRGYPNAVRTGPNAVLHTLELSLANPIEFNSHLIEPLPQFLGIAPFTFVDSGIVIPYRVDQKLITDDTLVSVGGGVSLQLGQNLYGSAYVGLPLKETTAFDDQGEAAFYWRVGISY